MNIGIIGYGLMGRNRAKALARIEGVRLAAAFDPDPSRVAEAAAAYGCAPEASVETLLHRPDLDAVIVAVPHFLTHEIATAALRTGRHVFCEKPLGLNMRECESILSCVGPGQRFASGFNYRFYPGIQKAKALLSSGAVGELTHVRFVLGHGGRPGYEGEWKTSKALCGGGALLDPGIHVIDLLRFLAGEVQGGDAHLTRSFWPVDVEDNAFATLRLEQNRVAQIHISITEWQSLFSLDLFGTDAQIQIRGRGGFYGPQRFRVVRRWEWLQTTPPLTEEEFPSEDLSFTAELRAFVEYIRGAAPGHLSLAEDGRRAMEILENLYSAARWNESSLSTAAIVR
ncbi:MAG TPA: Gfo/Idh/MocA family oxidoreductase [Bryobacteraceae bacterium]|nr:Gfo/Idh/MocA family oxidoreductase [Bryobacteraceae bacterium]